MKLITDSNLELVIQKFYERVVEEFSVADSAHRLETGRNLTIGEVSKTFDGTQDLFWSLTDIGIGSPSNLTTSNKSNVVNAINELNANKASIAYVDNAVENVSIDDAVTAVELVGNVEDIEIDFVTQSELEEALSNLDDIDIDGMVTAVDVGNVNIGQGGGSGGVDDSVIGQLSSLQTSNKTNLVGAINELFQNANNGKELIATAIGSPLSSSDTFSAMSTKINSLLSSFKTSMMNLGVTVNDSDKFQSLIEKLEAGREVTRSYDVVVRVELDGTARIIYPTSLDFGFIPDEITMVFENGLIINYPERNYSASIVISAVSAYGISLTGNGHVPGDHNALITVTGKESIGNSNTGTLVKTGEVTVSAVNKTFTLIELDPETGVETASETISLPCYTMTVDFEPSMINAEIVFNMEGDYSVTCTYRYDNLSNSNAKVVMAGFGFTLVTPLLKEGNTIYLPDIFSIESGEGTSTPKYPMSRSSYAAIGIGEVGEDPVLLESLKSILTEEGVTTSNDDTLASLITKVDSEFDRKNELVSKFEKLPAWCNTNNITITASNVPADAGALYPSLAAIGDNIYVVGGYNYTYINDDYSENVKTNYCYNTITNTWESKRAISVPLSGHAAVGYNNQMYVVGGWNEQADSASAAVYCYTPNSNSWTTKKNFSDSLDEHDLVVLNNQIYLLGGENDDTGTDNYTVYRYTSSSDTWTTAGNLPLNMVDFATTVVDNQLYITGGYSNDAEDTLSSTYYYNSSSRTWTTKRNMPTTLEDHRAVGVNGKIYTFSGMAWDSTMVDDDGDWVGSFAPTYCYNPASNSWTTENYVIPSGLMDVQAIEVNGKVYIMGGIPVSPYYYFAGDSSRLNYCYIP